MDEPIILEEEAEAKQQAQSFRTTTEVRFEICDRRFEKLEAGAGAGGAVDPEGNSLVGTLRTLSDRQAQLEALQSENVSAILRLADTVTSQSARIEALEAQVKALQPTP